MLFAAEEIFSKYIPEVPDPHVVDICCDEQLKPLDGFMVCTICGKTHRHHFDTSLASFSQSFYPTTPTYSRKRRFEKKLLAALTCKSFYQVDLDIIKFLKPMKIISPEELLTALAKYPKKQRRRPYMYITYYWQALGKTRPTPSEREIQLIISEFDRIFFAWQHNNFKRPEFPYSYLLHKIVNDGSTASSYGPAVKYLLRFVRVLRCKKRKKRYDDLFKICDQYDYQKMHPYLINGNRSNPGSETDI